MCDVTGEAGSRHNIFINGQNMGLPLQTWAEKAVHKVKTHWLSSKEKVLGEVISKKVMLTIL